MMLTASGLLKKGRLVAEREGDIYANLGLAFIEPELREGKDEIDLARQGELPKLVRETDIRRNPSCPH